MHWICETDMLSSFIILLETNAKLHDPTAHSKFKGLAFIKFIRTPRRGLPHRGDGSPSIRVRKM
jgi:hypothetical protein